MRSQRQTNDRRHRASVSRKHLALRVTQWGGGLMVVMLVGLGVWLWQGDWVGPQATSEVDGGPDRGSQELPANPQAVVSDSEQEKALRQEQREAVEALIALFPNNDDALYLAGCVHSEQGDSVSAARMWERAVALDDRRADAWDSLGNAYFFKDEYEKAETHFRKALEIDPGLGTTRHRLAVALSHQGRLEEVIATLNKAESLTAESQQLMGEVYQQLKDFGQAKTSYEAAIKLNPSLVQAYYGLSRVCAQLGDADQSGAYWEKFSELKKAKEDRAREWRDDYSPLETAQRSVAQTHTDVGRVYLSQGRGAQAEALWLRAAALDPSNTLCRLQLAVYYQQRRQDMPAVAYYEEVCQLDPADALARLNLGRALLRSRRIAQAERAFREVIRLKPDRPEGYADLAGLLLQSRKDLAEARSLAEQAVLLAPDAVHYALLSRVCIANSDREAALVAIEKAIVLEPANPEYPRARELLLGIR